MNSVFQYADMTQMPHTRSRVARIEGGVQHLARLTLLPCRRTWRDDPFATIELCAHESGAKNKQKDERIAEQSEIVCRQRLIESPQRGDFQPRPAATPINRDRSPPQPGVPRSPDPVGQTQSCWTDRVYVRLPSWLGLGFHGRRPPVSICITAADVTKLGRLNTGPSHRSLYAVAPAPLPLSFRARHFKRDPSLQSVARPFISLVSARRCRKETQAAGSDGTHTIPRRRTGWARCGQSLGWFLFRQPAMRICHHPRTIDAGER